MQSGMTHTNGSPEFPGRFNHLDSLIKDRVEAERCVIPQCSNNAPGYFFCRDCFRDMCGGCQLTLMKDMFENDRDIHTVEMVVWCHCLPEKIAEKYRSDAVGSEN